MSLGELYQTMPVQEHNIRVSGNRAYVKRDHGSMEEYVLGDERASCGCCPHDYRRLLLG